MSIDGRRCSKNMSVIHMDKVLSPKMIVKVVKSEIKAVLSNYLDVRDDCMYMDIIINKDGFYELRLRALSDRLKLAKSFIDEVI